MQCASFERERGHLGHPSLSTDLTTTCGELFRPPADKNTRWARSRFLTAGIFNLVANFAQVPPVRTHRLQGGREESADCSDCKSTRPLGTGVCGRAGVRPTTEFLLLGTKQGAPPRHQPARTAQTHGRGIKFFLTRKMNEKKLKTSCHYYGMFAKGKTTTCLP